MMVCSCIVALLKHNGVDVNAQDIEGRTPLMLACHLALLKVVPAMLKRNGEDVFLKNNDGKTALDAPHNAETA